MLVLDNIEIGIEYFGSKCGLSRLLFGCLSWIKLAELWSRNLGLKLSKTNFVLLDFNI